MRRVPTVAQDSGVGYTIAEISSSEPPTTTNRCPSHAQVYCSLTCPTLSRTRLTVFTQWLPPHSADSYDIGLAYRQAMSLSRYVAQAIVFTMAAVAKGEKYDFLRSEST